ncbi:MAG: hypothetical protein OXC95_18330 [Dehalococcoidia bacterium]|nr:hypothetical protein [Dehalococcoidia bacterium]
MLYEERRITLKRGQLDAYTAHLRDTVRPNLDGGEILCLLSAAIGGPVESVLQMARFTDYDAWLQAQSAYGPDRLELVADEEVRLLRSVSVRPKDVIEESDMRAFYGHRRFHIDPGDLDEFVHCSENGIWPRIESQGASILGLWATVASTSPLEVTLLTGYHGPAHGEATRQYAEIPDGMDEATWERSLGLHRRRSELPVKTWVRLMRRIEF